MTVAELRIRLEAIPGDITVVLKDDILKDGYFKPVEDIHVFDLLYLGDNLYTSREDPEEPAEPKRAVAIQ